MAFLLLTCLHSYVIVLLVWFFNLRRTIVKFLIESVKFIIGWLGILLIFLILALGAATMSVIGTGLVIMAIEPLLSWKN